MSSFSTDYCLEYYTLPKNVCYELINRPNQDAIDHNLLHHTGVFTSSCPNPAVDASYAPNKSGLL